MIPDETVDRVREAADIVQIIGEHVSLRRVGADWRGPCPFHQGTHRNFSVSPRKRMYYCFVCHEGGDVFNFLQKRLGLDWPSAVRLVADKSGIEVREVDSRREGPDPREPVWELNTTAADYFRRVLWEEDLGQPAREYLAQRNISRETAERFGLGFAPREIGLMRGYLNGLGFDDDRLLSNGLLVRREESEEPRPRFRGRLMFPIYDVMHRLAGFGGRLLGPGEPKYLNSAESTTFTKGKLLYGLNWAKQAIRRDERLLLVEGYFDVVRLMAAGSESVVAPLGTALTSDQAALVARYTKNVFLLYDSDRAGLKATFRAGDELLSRGLSVRVVTLPDGHDPDTFVDAYGPAALEQQLTAAVDVFERKVQLLERGGWFADLHRRRQAIDRLIPTIRATADAVTRDIYIARASEVSGVDRAVLAREAGSADASRVAPRQGTTGRPVREQPVLRMGERRVGERRTERAGGIVSGGRSVRFVGAERELVRALLVRRSQIEAIAERIGVDRFQDPRYAEIFAALLHQGPDATLEEVVALLSPDSADELDVLVAELDAIQDVQRTVDESLARFRERELLERNEEIQRLIALADEGEKNALLREKTANRNEIRALRGAPPRAAGGSRG